MEEQSKLAERILDQVADAVICANHSGTIIRWNHASTALFGYSAEEALGQRVELIIPDHLRAAHWSGFDAAMIKGATKLQGRPTLTRALHKNGRRLYVEMSFAIVKGDTKNEVLGAVAVARDVTERVERERAASRSS
jgi:PAS domain S-box-containing protein